MPFTSPGKATPVISAGVPPGGSPLVLAARVPIRITAPTKKVPPSRARAKPPASPYGLAQGASDGQDRQTLLKVAERAMDAWAGLAEASG